MIHTVRVISVLVCLLSASMSYGNEVRVGVAKAAMDTGVIQFLADEFQKLHPKTRIELKSLGALEAIDLLRKNEVDMTITHHSPEEKRVVSQGLGIHRTQLMYSEYALYGPLDSVAEFSSYKDIVDILRELASQEASFLEPSPRGGTYRKIRELWTAAGINPNWIGYENTGTSALSALRQSMDMDAFTIAETGTYISHHDEFSESIGIIYRNDLTLRNTYSVVVASPSASNKSNHRNANHFYEFLVSPSGQDLVRTYNDKHFSTTVLMPAAHLDLQLRERRAQKELVEKNTNLWIFITLSFVLSMLLFISIYLSRKMNLEAAKRHKMEAQSIAKEKARFYAEEENNSKTEFLKNISHEFRTPLHAIKSYTHLASKALRNDEIDTKRMQRYLENLSSSGDRLLELVNHILDYSQLESNEITLNLSHSDYSQLVGNCINKISEQAMQKEIHIIRNYSPDEIRMEIDAIRVSELIYNILANAIKYSPEKSSVTIEISTVSDNDSDEKVIKTQISDSGIGIPDKELEKIFHPFTQSSQTNSGTGGTGFGLSLCREIVKLHQGEIWAKSAVNNGSTFTFTIPQFQSR